MQISNGRVDLGLALSLLSSLLSLPFNKRYHVWLGVCFSLLALIHTWQHRRQAAYYLQKERKNMDLLSQYKKFTQPAKRAYLLQNIQVLHYIRGRVRLYSHHLLYNTTAASELNSYLETLPEISHFSVNPATGSVLIQYSPEDVANNPLLQDLEKLIAKQYGR